MRLFAAEDPSRIVGRSDLRPSRFHDEKGQFALCSARQIADASYALGTTVLRATVAYHPVKPWIALNALRFIEPRLKPDGRVFEWGSGMSTLWYEKHCGEVHAVEDNPDWHRLVSGKVKHAEVHHLCGPHYVDKIRDFPPSYFDLISIDGSERLACFEIAHGYLAPNGLLVIDNTDKDRTTKGDLYQIDELLSRKREYVAQRFTGWTPGNFFPQETTVCWKR